MDKPMDYRYYREILSNDFHILYTPHVRDKLAEAVVLLFLVEVVVHKARRDL
jgi:hypothetical protein